MSIHAESSPFQIYLATFSILTRSLVGLSQMKKAFIHVLFALSSPLNSNESISNYNSFVLFRLLNQTCLLWVHIQRYVCSITHTSIVMNLSIIEVDLLYQAPIPNMEVGTSLIVNKRLEGPHKIRFFLFFTKHIFLALFSFALYEVCIIKALFQLFKCCYWISNIKLHS